jgi:hypothetical protein
VYPSSLRVITASRILVAQDTGHRQSSAVRPPKKHGDVLPLTADARTATQQLPSCCRSRSRTSRRHQSRISLTRQSRSTGRRRRRGAAECTQTAPPCAPCALRSDSRAFSAREAAKPAASIASDGGGAVLTAERPGLIFDIVVLFPLVSLPVAVRVFLKNYPRACSWHMLPAGPGTRP